MTKHGSRKQSGTRSDQRSSPRERSEPRRRRSSASVDLEALALRERGASYSAIARQLELRRAVDAHGAFLRAVQALGVEEREHVTANEERRLDELEVRIRERDGADLVKVERRLLAARQLRAALH